MPKQTGERGGPRPSPEQLERFHDSLDRCSARAGFFERFYERFQAADPRVSALFAQTDMARQQRMLRLSLALVMNLSLADPGIDQQLQEIARRHTQLAIASDLYDIWRDELLAAVAERDPRFDEGVRLAWLAVLRRGIAFMHEHGGAPGPA